MKKISIQGVPGSFSHLATEVFFESFELNCHKDFPSTFHSLEKNQSDYAVIPIENSTVGSIIENFSLLAKYKFNVIAETFVKVNFHLLAHKQAKFEDIQEVYSHSAALGQIRNFLKNHTQIKAIDYFDTAGAAEMVSNARSTAIAAACSRKAGELSALKVLKENIHDNPKNYTRFFLISKKADPIIAAEADKTTIQFELGKEAGSLALFLNLFAQEGISLTKIESRPLMDTNWEYLFFIDVLAGLGDLKMQQCLEKAKSLSRNLRVIGSYKSGTTIES